MDAIQEEYGIIDHTGEETYILGKPISPRLDKRSYSYGSERSSRRAGSSTTETSLRGEGMHGDTPGGCPSASSYIIHSRPFSPVSQHSVSPPSTPTPSNRRSLPLFDEMRYMSATASSSTIRVETPPTPAKGLRSQVSMDAVGAKPDQSSARSLRHFRSASSLSSSYTSMSQTVEERESIGSWREVRQPQSPRSSKMPVGRDRRQSRDEVDLGSDGETDDFDESSSSTRTDSRLRARFADETLRSQPGVRGIGEGWAGGPTRDPKKRWWRRRVTLLEPDQDDPLNLWTSTSTGSSGHPEKQGESSRTGIKAKWNRSFQKFGGSMPHLSTIPSSKPSESRSKWKKVMRRSRSDISVDPTLGAGSAGASTVNLPASPFDSRARSAASRSTPVLLETLAKLNGERKDPIHHTNYQKVSLRDSWPDPGQVATTTTMAERRVSGPRPPRRPLSMYGQLPVRDAPMDIQPIQEREEEIPTSNAAKEPPLEESEDSPPADRAYPHAIPLARTDTFGTAESDPAGAEFGPLLPSSQSQSQDHLRDSVVGFDTLASWGAEPKAKTILPERRLSLFKRIQKALNASSRSTPRARSATPGPSPLRMFSKTNGPNESASPDLNTTRSTPVPPKSPMFAPIDPASDYTLEPLSDAADRPKRSMTSMSNRGERRSSWLSSRPSSERLKRLSRLTEKDENESEEKRHSFFHRVLPDRSSSLPLETPDVGRSTFVSRSLRPFSTTDLGLTLELPDEPGLGLDDIIIDSRRQSIIDHLSLEAFPSPPLRSSGASADPFGRTGHSRGASEPPKISDITMSRSDSHKRTISEPSDSLPPLDESKTVSEKSSSTAFPETPRTPPGEPELTYPAPLGMMMGKSGLSSWTSLATQATFYSAKETLPAIPDQDGDERDRRDSTLSEVSEAGAITEAVRIPSLRDMTMKAEVLTMDDLRRTQN